MGEQGRKAQGIWRGRRGAGAEETALLEIRKYGRSLGNELQALAQFRGAGATAGSMWNEGEAQRAFQTRKGCEPGAPSLSVIKALNDKNQKGC